MSPHLIAEPVADVVLVPSVHEHADACLELGGQQLLVALHPVAVELEAERDAVIAVSPARQRERAEST